jgi:hypothetical protein
LIAPEAAQNEVRGQTRNGMGGSMSSLAWPGLLRQLDRELPGYDA